MLAATDLSFGYGGAPIIDRWSAVFEAGEVTAITGPSGRGKSTLLYLLGLMLKPSSGTVTLDGESLAELSDRRRSIARARRFGFVFQDAALDATRSILDNVTEAALYRDQNTADARIRAYELLAQFGVELRATAKPGQVSGGQAQRIALCRALLHSPDVLLADEPTGNLDPASASIVVDAFKAHAASGKIVVIVTHDPSLVVHCDKSIQL